MGTVISFANAKGGVAKTSLALAIADEFSRQGKRVLLIDFDPQATITQFFGVPDGEFKEFREYSIGRLYDTNVTGGGIAINNESYACPYSVRDTLDVVFSTKLLQSISESSMPAKEYILRDYVDAVKGKYDVVIVDPPGVLGFFLSSVMLASDILFIPQRVNFYDNSGTRSFLEAILYETRVRRMTVNIGGFIPVFFEKVREEAILAEMKELQELYKEYLRVGSIKHVGDEIWLPKVRRLVAWEAAASEDMFLRDYVEKRDRSKIRVLDDVVALRDAMWEVIDKFQVEELQHV